MWSSFVEEIVLDKGERGLGFSILDYQVILCIFKFPLSIWSARISP